MVPGPKALPHIVTTYRQMNEFGKGTTSPSPPPLNKNNFQSLSHVRHMCSRHINVLMVTEVIYAEMGISHPSQDLLTNHPIQHCRVQAGKYLHSFVGFQIFLNKLWFIFKLVQ